NEEEEGEGSTDRFQETPSPRLWSGRRLRDRERYVCVEANGWLRVQLLLLQGHHSEQTHITGNIYQLGPTSCRVQRSEEGVASRGQWRPQRALYMGECGRYVG